jgi:hypothetical protein
MMGERHSPNVELENEFLSILRRVVTRPRTSLLEPPVPVELVQTDLENAKFREYSSLHIEQAVRSCVYRIAVGS